MQVVYGSVEYVMIRIKLCVYVHTIGYTETYSPAHAYTSTILLLLSKFILHSDTDSVCIVKLPYTL